jgi:hypothetical protein
MKKRKPFLEPWLKELRRELRGMIPESRRREIEAWVQFTEKPYAVIASTREDES